MASSESQGLQIALIIFVILTILLSVTTFMFFREGDELRRDAQAARDQATQANTGLTKAQTELNDLKDKVIGVDIAQSTAQVIESFNSDMQRYAGTLPADKQRYRVALDTLYQALVAVQQERDALVAERNALQQERDALVSERDRRIATAEGESQRASADLQQERATFGQDRQRLQQERDEQAARVTAAQQELNDAIAANKTQVEDLIRRIEGLDRELVSRNEQLDQLRNDTFEVADGEIRWVNQRTGTVWINLGQADQLTRQVTFSVYPANGGAVGTVEPKASIEVTQILGQHLAEARILSDSLSDPIVVGDQIFTPLWTANRAEHFAIAGRIDLDNDSLDDRDVVRDLITMSGGVVDSELTEAGERVGQMTNGTRYLLLGDPPAEAALSEYATIQKDAQRLGVELITVDKFLDHVGAQRVAQVLRFGRRGNADQLAPEPPDGGRPAAAGAVSEIFRERRPPGRGRSAFDRGQPRDVDPAATEDDE